MQIGIFFLLRYLKDSLETCIVDFDATWSSAIWFVIKKKLKVVFEIFLIVCALFTDDCGSWLQWPVICDMKKKEFNVCKTTHCDPLCRPNTLGLSVPCRWQRFSTLPLLIWNATVPDSRSSQDGERERGRKWDMTEERGREGGRKQGGKEGISASTLHIGGTLKEYNASSLTRRKNGTKRDTG